MFCQHAYMVSWQLKRLIEDENVSCQQGMAAGL